MRRYGHHRTGAVISQHIVSCIDRQLFVVDRVDRVYPQEHPTLGTLRGLPLDLGGPFGGLQILFECRTLGRGDDLSGQFGLGSHHEEGCPKERVGSGGEYPDRFGAAFDLKVHIGTLRAADPVALHRQHSIGPFALDLLHIVEQPLGVFGDLEIPLRELAFGDHRVATVTLTLNYLLIGQHRLVFRTPVDEGIFAVGQTALVETQEQPLGPAVILLVRSV